jgi:hypothetical protein
LAWKKALLVEVEQRREEEEVVVPLEVGEVHLASLQPQQYQVSTERIQHQ